MYDKILALIQEHGPSLPVEIASKTNINSFLAKAYLTDLVDQSKLIAGERIGSTNMFFLPGQEELANQRAQELLSATRTVATHTGKDLDMSPEAVAKREHFKRHFEKTLKEPDKPRKKLATKPRTTSAPKPTPQRPRTTSRPARISGPSKPASVASTQGDRLQGRVSKGGQAPYWASTKEIDKQFKSAQKPSETITQRITKLFTPPKKAAKPKSKPKSTAGGYITNVKNMFYTGQSKVVEELEAKKKQGKFIVEFPSSIGAIRHFVTVLDKKTINKSDIALAYTEATNKRLPALLVTNGKLASTAEDYAGELGGMFRWKVVK